MKEIFDSCIWKGTRKEAQEIISKIEIGQHVQVKNPLIEVLCLPDHSIYFSINGEERTAYFNHRKEGEGGGDTDRSEWLFNMFMAWIRSIIEKIK